MKLALRGYEHTTSARHALVQSVSCEQGEQRRGCELGSTLFGVGYITPVTDCNERVTPRRSAVLAEAKAT